jgi:hypothetical protein
MDTAPPMPPKQRDGSHKSSSNERRAPKPSARKSWYSPQDFSFIVKAIDSGFPEEKISQKAFLFERAADWYWRARNEPERLRPSVTRRRLRQISAAAHKLLKHLDVRKAAEADDGPPDDRIIDALVDAIGGTEDVVVRAVGRVGRLIEVVESIAALKEIERRATKAAEEDDQGLIVPKGHVGDLAVRNWIADMMDVYNEVTGKAPSHGTSEGDDLGPFLRFLKTAGAPLGIEFSKEQWRNRVRQLRTSRQK